MIDRLAAAWLVVGRRIEGTLDPLAECRPYILGEDDSEVPDAGFFARIKVRSPGHFHTSFAPPEGKQTLI